ncbi:MAG: hypothetical protein JXB62_23800 [Pirellulales bacterium]|nr:hypothetical protein [Pirellulales bacterium]
MNTTRCLSVGVVGVVGIVLALLTGGQAARAEGWSLEKLNPVAAKPQPRTTGRSYARASSYGKKTEPSALEKLDAGTKKLFADAAEGTKKFFRDTKDALTWKKPAPKTASRPYVPWIQPPKDPRHLRSAAPKKKSWFDSLFVREEPKRVESMKDWVGLPRPEM